MAIVSPRTGLASLVRLVEAINLGKVILATPPHDQVIEVDASNGIAIADEPPGFVAVVIGLLAVRETMSNARCRSIHSPESSRLLHARLVGLVVGHRLAGMVGHGRLPDGPPQEYAQHGDGHGVNRQSGKPCSLEYRCQRSRGTQNAHTDKNPPDVHAFDV